MDRILQAAPAALSETFYQDGVVADPGVTGIVVTRADGSTVVSASASGSGPAARTFNLTAAHTAALDTLRVTWTSANLGTSTSYVEVVGGFLFTIADARGKPPLNDVATYPAAEVARARTQAEQDFEAACCVSFVPRYALEKRSGRGRCDLGLKWPLVRAVRSVTVNGTALTAGQLATIVPMRTGLHYPSGFPYGWNNVLVGYEHGFDDPPGNVGGAALALAKENATPPAFDEIGGRRVLMAQAGEEQFTFVSPLASGNSPFGIPEVDSVYRSNRFWLVR